MRNMKLLGLSKWSQWQTQTVGMIKFWEPCFSRIVIYSINLERQLELAKLERERQAKLNQNEIDKEFD